ncbi:hypothetical protein C6376_05395 [Streptomyces sp. P3]|nr:hypothetical protein C6376_05395 [Streptomyces sp. P3]
MGPLRAAAAVVWVRGRWGRRGGGGAGGRRGGGRGCRRRGGRAGCGRGRQWARDLRRATGR